MKRYSKNLKQHVELAENHAKYLVESLAFNANRASALQKKLGIGDKEPLPEQLHAMYSRMVECVKELGCVEAWVKQNYPQLNELYDTIKTQITTHENTVILNNVGDTHGS